MVGNAIKSITNKISGLREAAFWLSLFALFSQILAFLRDRLLAHNFGAGEELDTYYAAFKFPDLIFVTVASLVSISALVPLFAKKETEGEKHLKDATASIFTVFSVTIVLSCVLAWFAMPLIITKSFIGLSLAAQTETILLSRILLLSPLLLGFSNFFSSIVQYEKRFILYSLSPLLYNLGIIAGIVFFTNSFGIKAAAIGVVFGALLHLLMQAIFVLSSPMRPKFTLKIKWEDVLETAKLSIPRTFALSIVSFVAFFFAALASKLPSGSIAIFNLSSNLQSVPLSLIGVSFSLAAFPSLAISAAKKNTAEVIEKISDGLKQIIFWSLPFTALFIVLRAHIVRVVLGSGVFDWSATRLVAASLALFVLSAVFQGIQLFLSRSHYALGKTKWPLFGNIFGGAVSVLSALIFIKYFDGLQTFFNFIAETLKVSDLASQVLLLPLAYSLGSLASAVVLFFALGDGFYKEVWQRIKVCTLKTLIGSIVCGAGAYFTLGLFDGLFNLETFLGVLGHGSIAGIVGVLVGVCALSLIQSAEYREVKSKISK